jgi:hypothetical protein
MQDMMTTGHMTWPMGVGMAVMAVLLILGVVSVFKYIVFR